MLGNTPSPLIRNLAILVMCIVPVTSSASNSEWLNVEAFPNDHVFGLSNMGPEGIIEHAYDAFEPTVRITDRYARPLEPGAWYEIWLVVNNSSPANGGQIYDMYMRGGSEFPEQAIVYSGADFRMKRNLAIIYFSATRNTGSKEKPYGNGGVKYDDLYMKRGVDLLTPSFK